MSKLGQTPQSATAQTCSAITSKAVIRALMSEGRGGHLPAAARTFPDHLERLLRNRFGRNRWLTSALRPKPAKHQRSQEVGAVPQAVMDVARRWARWRRVVLERVAATEPA